LIQRALIRKDTMNLFTLTTYRAIDRLAIAAYDATGLACLAAQHAHAWLAPRVARLEQEVDAAAALKRARKETGAAFKRMSERLGWTVEDLRGLRDAFTSIPWTGTAGSPDPEPRVSDGYQPPDLWEDMQRDPLAGEWPDDYQTDSPDFDEARDRVRAEIIERTYPSRAMAEPTPTVDYLNRLLGVDPDGAA
jgi:hypothetical protein